MGSNTIRVLQVSPVQVYFADQFAGSCNAFCIKAVVRFLITLCDSVSVMGCTCGTQFTERGLSEGRLLWFPGWFPRWTQCNPFRMAVWPCPRRALPFLGAHYVSRRQDFFVSFWAADVRAMCRRAVPPSRFKRTCACVDGDRRRRLLCAAPLYPRTRGDSASALRSRLSLAMTSPPCESNLEQVPPSTADLYVPLLLPARARGATVPAHY